MCPTQHEHVFGRNPTLEVLRANRRSVFKIRIAEGANIKGALQKITQLAREQSIPLERIPGSELDAEFRNHQGVAATVSPYPYLELSELISKVVSAGPKSIVLVLDQIQDPQNLGALLRSAEAFGVAGVLLPRRRAVGITGVVVRASSGASEHLNIARYNLVQAIEVLKEEGFWVAGLENDPSAPPLEELERQGLLAMIIGSEGAGMRRLVREACDYLVRIPIIGKIDSLNASVAGSIALYALSRHE